MEFEIDEFAVELWIAEPEMASANRPPTWCRDGRGGEHTGVWDAEQHDKQLELT